MSAVVFAETVRRHLTSAGYLAFLAFIAITGIFVATFRTPGALWPSLISALAIVTGSAIVGPEFTTGALQLIVSKPVARHAYVLGRVAGVWAATGLAAAIALFAEVLTRLMIGAPLSLPRLLEIFTSELIVALLAIAFLTLLGSVTVSYFNVAIYLGLQFAFFISESITGAIRVRNAFIAAHPGILQSLVAIDDTLFPSVPPELTVAWMLRNGALIFVALSLACLAFQRREVPYGSD